jgi:hypothetical protein
MSEPDSRPYWRHGRVCKDTNRSDNWSAHRHPLIPESLSFPEYLPSSMFFHQGRVITDGTEINISYKPSTTTDNAEVEISLILRQELYRYGGRHYLKALQDHYNQQIQVAIPEYSQ